MRLLTTTLVLIGSFLLLFSVGITWRVQGLVSAEFKRKWSILTFLICFFVLGYFGFIGIQMVGFPIPLELLTSIVFIGGALFVLSVMTLARDSIARLNDLNENLERIVEDRTFELQGTNRSLIASKEKIQNQNVFLESVLNALSHPFYVVDTNNYQIMMSNKAANLSEFVGETCYSVTHGTDRPCNGNEHPCSIEEVRKKKGPVVHEHIHRDTDGNKRYVEVHAYPIYNEAGDLSKIIEYVLDITDRKVIEQELLLARNEAESANLSKGKFLAEISHEIRTSLNAILGMANLTLATNLLEKQRYYLVIIKESSELLLRLIGDILDFSKIEAGKLVLEMREFALIPVLESVISSMKTKAENKGLQLLTDFNEECNGLWLIGDDLRLRQILLNLIGNAIKFTTKGKITVSLFIEERDSESITLRATVTDTGMGIPKKVQKNIFESYVQADAGIARNFGGTGLGLAICRRLTELMGGSIWLNSMEGVGSSFSFTIKMTPCKRPLSQEVFREKSREKVLPLRILLVDDISLNRELVRIILEQEGHSITEAQNGLVALETLVDFDFDLVLIDVQMPVMDGFVAVNYIRLCEKGEVPAQGRYSGLLTKLSKRLYGRHVPVVAITANVMSGERNRCLEAGMDGYICKPFRAEEMVEQIAAVYPTTRSEPSM